MTPDPGLLLVVVFMSSTSQTKITPKEEKQIALRFPMAVYLEMVLTAEHEIQGEALFSGSASNSSHFTYT